MSSPDPLAAILDNCAMAMRAIAEAQSTIAHCIAGLEAKAVLNGPVAQSSADVHDRNDPRENAENLKAP